MDTAGVVSVDDEEGNASHDEEIARGLALDEHMANDQSPPVVTTAVVASTSTSTSTASSKMKLNIHLQDTTQKFRATAASRKREQVTNEMINLIKETNKQVDEDDELDLSFASMAKRMRKNLNDKQREKVLSSIQKLVSTAIENAEQGFPVVPPPPNLFQGLHRPPTPQNFGPPPLLQPLLPAQPVVETLIITTQDLHP